eukprot:comp9002_c0_seq1/m.4200 comp9002_c0_seq1/g.4200  ORF comp9002_c0_seq1/g.4200 comp9002_c0_seq1/m.4200 type:complete len:225 (-) comp9002_c0_seq1:275-949(-)
MSGHIRAATLEDTEAMALLHKAAILVLAGEQGVHTPEQLHDWAASVRPQGYYLAIQRNEAYVLEEEDGTLGGFITWSSLGFPQGEVESLHVHPSRAKQGRGHRLLKHVELLAQQGSLTEMMLKASCNAHVTKFYSAQGYIEQYSFVHSLRNSPLTVIRVVYTKPLVPAAASAHTPTSIAPATLAVSQSSEAQPPRPNKRMSSHDLVVSEITKTALLRYRYTAGH